ncbi:hypothetical protein D9M71_588680 [compost metagenome]
MERDAHDDLWGLGGQHEGAQRLPSSLHPQGVFVGTTDHIGGAANQGLEGLATAGEIDHLDIEALFTEIAFLQGDRQRQIVENGLTAHCKGDFRALKRGSGY